MNSEIQCQKAGGFNDVSFQKSFHVKPLCRKYVNIDYLKIFKINIPPHFESDISGKKFIIWKDLAEIVLENTGGNFVQVSRRYFGSNIILLDIRGRSSREFKIWRKITKNKFISESDLKKLNFF
ncbi:hypothetical protein OAG24_00045 [bacterium]|nr:hypothetical protein [bacterium]